MPLTHGLSYFLAPLLALALVGVLALVLKWAFSDVAEPDDLDDIDTRPRGADRRDDDVEIAEVATAEPAVTATPPAPLETPDPLAGPTAVAGLPMHEDYGLLRVVTVAECDDAAHAAVSLLAEAGIRATTTTGADGQVRVLVFESDLFRARRVVGWPA
ncbi:hypothetical protein [Luedemannella helvata]|uniref:SPOR domain-containing protein n=1 Tax=Luedemannella helvata TaxID=349315 RepID=A0ABP4W919_9ACTN